MKKNLKRFLNLFMTLGMSAFVVFGIVSVLSNSKRDLRTVDFYKGKIAEKGIISNPVPKIDVTRIFFFRLEGLDQKLATVDEKEDYSRLDSALAVGDEVSVHFKAIDFADVPNLNVYQIGENGAIVVAEGDIENKELKGSILGSGVVLLILVVGYFRDRKIRRAAAATE